MSARSLILPPPLAPGARVALIAPSGPLGNRDELACAIANAELLGWVPVLGESVMSRFGYLAGTDTERLRDLHAALRDPEMDGIWCVRGGYGAMRLLPSIEPALIRSRPRSLIGYSDITALHALWQSAGVCSFHGPTAREPLTSFAEQSLRRAVVECGNSTGAAPGAQMLRKGRAAGRLMGGNLALLAALTGTPWQPSFSDAILILEDIDEPAYRIDRMLTQLRLAGALEGVRGIVFGECTRCPDTAGDGARTVEVIVRELADFLAVPALMDAPIGHIESQWTLPLGAYALLDATAQSLDVDR